MLKVKKGKTPETPKQPSQPEVSAPKHANAAGPRAPSFAQQLAKARPAQPALGVGLASPAPAAPALVPLALPTDYQPPAPAANVITPPAALGPPPPANEIMPPVVPKAPEPANEITPPVVPKAPEPASAISPPALPEQPVDQEAQIRDRIARNRRDALARRAARLGNRQPADAVAPTDAPTETPTVAPTEAPTVAPTEAPTEASTEAPNEAPTDEAPTEAPTNICAICRDNLMDGSPRQALECMHSFHAACIQEYMEVSGKPFRYCCPYKCFAEELEEVNPPPNDEAAVANPGAAAPLEAAVLEAMGDALLDAVDAMTS